jgi:hypothetical protein
MIHGPLWALTSFEREFGRKRMSKLTPPCPTCHTLSRFECSCQRFESHGRTSSRLSACSCNLSHAGSN